MRERREYVRSNGLVLVNYKVPQLDLEGKSSAYDVSGVGMRISVDRNLENGTLLELEIYLPGSSQPILAKGEVAWSEQFPGKAAARMADDKKYFYAAVRFTVIDENNRARIADYVYRKVHQK